MAHPSDTDLDRVIERARADLDLAQLAVLRQFTPERRLQLMFELCEFVHHAIIAYERQRAPDISDEELCARYRRHIHATYATTKPA
ncbi:MAG: hypothetical protein HZB53_09625 [Chloroflexi bacterium]|nr:hypothetical protein [Chloroflexota bacterium]